MNQDYIYHFHNYLDQLKTELAAYPEEAQLWLCPAAINNSAGNLCLHLVGNLNHFIGFAMGRTGYIREREREFSEQDVPRKELMQRVDEVKILLAEVLEKQDDLNKDYPAGLFNEGGSINRQLLRLLAHLAYHVGQINYHRRLLTA